MSSDFPALVQDLPTPCFLVDVNRVKLNASRMLERAASLGVKLRPHMKTHKTLELGELQTGGTKKGIVVSTLPEATYFAENGFDDIIYSLPITSDKLARCRPLAEKYTFHLMFDSMEAIQALRNSPLKGGKKWSVFLSVDTGYHREGVAYDGDIAVTLAKEAANSSNIIFQGIYTHEGQSYDKKGEEELKTFGETIVDHILHVKKRIEEAGVSCEHYSVGSTPSCTKPPQKYSLLSELHPGNYIFYDYEHYYADVVGLDEIGCRVATRVVSHGASGDHMLVDCGFLAIGHDGVAMKDKLPYGFCVFKDNLNLRMVSMSQELGTVKDVNGKIDVKKYPIGTMLFIYPWHSCETAAMHPVYYAHDGDKVVATYKPVRGW